MVFRLLRRGDTSRLATHREAGWTGRFHGVARALDLHDMALRDVAIASAGSDVWVSALEFRGAKYRSTWAPVTYRIEDVTDEYVAVETTPRQRLRPADWTTVVRPDPWAERLRAVGALLDRSATPPRDVVVLEIEDGFVVQGLVATIPPTASKGDADSNAQWVTETREIDAKTIEATIRDLPPVANVRLMRLQALARA